jgi:predicted AAA+ superfamily ATPase
MSISNHDRITKALQLLKEGLYPFVEREMKSVHGERWLTLANGCLPDSYVIGKQVAEVVKEDVSALLILMWKQWDEVFKTTLGRTERSIVSELRNTRNDWAHTKPFSSDDTDRALDSMARLLSAISAPEAQVVDASKQDLRRIQYDDKARREVKKVASSSMVGTPQAGLKPWREIVTPHQDVASGRYQQAEFAADLWEVFLDRGSDEYRLPTEFFQRTYLTAGLQQLLTNALTRLSGSGGDPVIELQTNFGGGKTHAMLALYHLCMGVPAAQLPGMETVFEKAGVTETPQDVNTVVLVGNKISPGQPITKTDGTVVNTLWGEIAWQLGGKEGYETIAQADKTGTNPGDTLKDVFDRYAPCLILVDEWVAYARQLHGDNDLPGGSFDTHITFAQTLSESAKNADRTLLVVSIPASDIEIGGERGQEATARIKNAIGRVESPWRPASAEESFEIVRRRLFQPLDGNNYVMRDAVVRSYFDLYVTQKTEFPSECAEVSYKNRLTQAYPIHPELFDRLYSDWSSLDKFQRTRGVLRLMAKVIYTLWERDDRNLLIMPASIAIDDAQTQSELTRYLDDNWIPILEKDVDGANSVPVQLDRDQPNLGRYSATRRVARTIYLGSAPNFRSSNRGIEDKRIKLGCVQPGEPVAVFGDALRRLREKATYLYTDTSNRYWISTQQNVTRQALDRASQILEDKEDIWAEIIKRLKQDKERGEFASIHIAPQSGADIPDDNSTGVKLVILHPQQSHINKSADSLALTTVNELLTKRGTSPRYYKNLLIFLAPALPQLQPLENSVAQYLAWESIVRDKETLNLDVSQSNQATSNRDKLHKEVDNFIREAYQWMLVPEQPNPQGAIEWEAVRLQGNESPIVRASRKLIHEERLITNYAPSNLRLTALDPYLWKDTNHINLKQLWEYLSTYTYLPRLKNSEVLRQTIHAGVMNLLWQENYAYATGWDETKQKYLGLKAGTQEPIQIQIDSQCLIVKPEIASAQLQAESRSETIDSTYISPRSSSPSANDERENSGGFKPEKKPSIEQIKVLPKRFYGTVELTAERINRDVPTIADAVIQHLTKLSDTRVKITLEIHADLANGATDDVVRTVLENCNTLKFINKSFEQE